MRDQFLKVFEGKRQKPTFSTAMIGGWILPSWFVKQSDLSKPGYIFGNYRFANLCFRNWTAFCDDKGLPVLNIDREGTISFPQIGVSIEIWVNDGKKLITPGRFIQTKQTIDEEFLCIETTSSFQNGFCQSRIFPIDGLHNTCIGLELNLYAPAESAFSDFLVCLVVRPYDHDGLSAIRQLEYKNKRLKVNYIELLQLEIEPKIVFCTHAGLGEITDFFKLEKNNLAIVSMDGSCTGLIGYSVRAADQTKIKLILKPDSVKYLPKLVREFTKKWLWESKQIWLNRCLKQHHMLKTGLKIDRIYHINLNYLVMFNRCSSDLDDIDNILVLNRYAFFEQSRMYLLKALKKVRWDGSLSNSRISPEKLIFAVYDYFQLSYDINLIRENWQSLKRMGYWLLQNQAFLRSDANWRQTENPAWLCSSFKALSQFGEVNNDFENNQLFYQQYQLLWTQILETFSRKIKENNYHYYRKKDPISEVINSLAISFPLRLYQINERFILKWLERILEESTFNGGVISPMEFQGIDLELTARLGVVLLREGREYDGVFKLLIETISSTGNWPDRFHPFFNGGIGLTGHSPEVGYQFLLMLRNIMVMEEGEILHILPGVTISKLWFELNIKLNNFPTIFGEISLKCQSIGEIVQIEFKASFRRRPRQIRLILNKRDCLLYSDGPVAKEGEYVYLDSNFKIVRFRRDRS